MPQAQFLAGFWMLGEGHDKAEEWRKAVGADFVADFTYASHGRRRARSECGSATQCCWAIDRGKSRAGFMLKSDTNTQALVA